MTIRLIEEKELHAASRSVVLGLSREMQELVPAARIEEIGSTTIPGSVTKGDVDLVVLVNKKAFDSAKAALRANYDVNEMEQIDYFASFKGELAGIDFGIQLTTPDTDNFGFLQFRDALRASPKLVREYNRVKRLATGLPMDEYRAKKYEFIETVLKRDGAAR